MSRPRQFRYPFRGQRRTATIVGAGGITIGLGLVVPVSLGREPIFIRGSDNAPVWLVAVGGLLIIFFGALLLVSKGVRLRLTVEDNALTIHSRRRTRVALHDLLAVNVEEILGQQQLIIWPRRGAMIAPTVGGYPARSSLSSGLILCPVPGWDASSEEVVAAVQGVAGPLWRVPPARELTEGRTRFVRRPMSRLVATLIQVLVFGLLPSAWFSVGAAVLDFSRTAHPSRYAFTVVTLLMLGMALIAVVRVVVNLLPQSVSLREAGLEIKAGGKRDLFAWSEFEWLGQPSADQTHHWLIGRLAPGVSRPRFRFAGFPCVDKSHGYLRLVNLSGWDATAAEMLVAVRRFAGSRYNGRFPSSQHLPDAHSAGNPADAARFGGAD